MSPVYKNNELRYSNIDILICPKCHIRNQFYKSAASKEEAKISAFQYPFDSEYIKSV